MRAQRGNAMKEKSTHICGRGRGSGSNKLEEYGQGEHLGGDVTREKIQFSVRTGPEHWIHGIKIKIGNTSFSLFTFF